MKERRSDRIWDFEGDEVAAAAAMVTATQRKSRIGDEKSVESRNEIEEELNR